MSGNLGARPAPCGPEGDAMREGCFAASGTWIGGAGDRLTGGMDLDILCAFPRRSFFISSPGLRLVEAEPAELDESSVSFRPVL